MHVPPPVYALGAAIAQHLLAPKRRSGVLRKVAAAALGGASASLAVGAVQEFRRNGTTVDPLEPARASTLVTTGPNQVTRNPMYLGLAGGLAAHAVLRGGWSTTLPLAGFVVAIDRLQIAQEEAALRERFGAAYDDYCATVPRWLGPF